ncbi:MAG: Gfo/Idh/MocA family protein [Angustibacter sp.]
MTDVVLVGAGSVGQRHARVLTGLEDVRITAVVDPVAGAAEHLAGVIGATAYLDAGQALDEHRPDAVYVCVPPFAHGPAERAALERGLPLFVEKPLAADLETAQELAGLVERAGVVTGTGYHWRCLDTVERAARLLHDTSPLLVSGSWFATRPPVAWWSRRRGSGGQVVEQLTHLLDVARDLLGEAVGVAAAATSTTFDPEQVDDATAAVVRFGCGAVGTFAATSVLPSAGPVVLDIVAAGTRLSLTETCLVIDGPDGRHEITPAVDPRVAVDQEFIAAVRGERASTRVPYAEALRTHQLACAITTAATRDLHPVDPSGVAADTVSQ